MEDWQNTSRGSDMSEFDTDILRSFIEESQEHLSGIENDLLSIEAAGEDIDVELVNKVFRAVHSIKGGAGFLGLETITALSNSMWPYRRSTVHRGAARHGQQGGVKCGLAGRL